MSALVQERAAAKVACQVAVAVRQVAAPQWRKSTEALLKLSLGALAAACSRLIKIIKTSTSLVSQSEACWC